MNLNRIFPLQSALSSESIQSPTNSTSRAQSLLADKKPSFIHSVHVAATKNQKLKELQAANSYEYDLKARLIAQWNDAATIICDTLNGKDIQRHVLGFTGSISTKQTVRQELFDAAKTDKKMPYLRLLDFSSNLEKIEKNMITFEGLIDKYQSILETYEALKNKDGNAYKTQLDLLKDDAMFDFTVKDDDGNEILFSKVLLLIVSAEKKIIGAVETLLSLVKDELDRLICKRDELSKKAVEQTEFKVEKKPKQKQRKKRSEKLATLQAPQKMVTTPSKNRIDINIGDKILSGKPRANNIDIVDILDRHGQRKETYIRSPNGQLWIRYSSIQNTTTVGSKIKKAIKIISWDQLRSKAEAIIKDVESGEETADFLQKKGDGQPSTPEGLLRYHANRLKEIANEIQQAESKFATDSERIQSRAKINELNNRADKLLEKGQAIKIEMICKQSPTSIGLKYLANQALIQICKSESRVLMNRKIFATGEKISDYLDEYELKVKGKVWAYAHMHYSTIDAKDMHFSAAHLKSPAQRYQGVKAQANAEYLGRPFEINRAALSVQQVRKYFCPEVL